MTRAGFLASTLLQLALSIAVSALITGGPRWYWPGLLLSWMLTAGAARKLQVTVLHHCVHANFSGSGRLDRWIVEVFSSALLVMNFESYRHDHVIIHHSRKLATLDDPDLKFLLALGFLPGVSREALWRRLAWTLVSPRFHAMFLMARLASNVTRAAPYRRLMALGLHAVIVVIVAAKGAWLTWLVAWVFPLTFLYHIAALLQFICEHRWLRVADPGQPAKVVLARLTAGRFMGEPAPPPGLAGVQRAWAWGRWAARMLLVHLPFRLLVMVGDLPQHDWHHRHIQARDWPNAAYARQRDIEAGHPGWPEPYSEVWGLLPAVDAVFVLLSSLPSLAQPSKPAPPPDAADVVRDA
ncbi:hypothetical protein BE11_45505 [Sorangium cellulosum]|nr:hypothetical protein BE11_45505 [Sorangium cellulosum]